VDGVSFSVRPGEVHVTLRAMMRLLPQRRPDRGRDAHRRQDVLALKRRALRELRGSFVSMIFRNAHGALRTGL
jgi:ABC-type microcin C transport system duplicated ATPase subunit YejF